MSMLGDSGFSRDGLTIALDDYGGERTAVYNADVGGFGGPDAEITARYLEAIPGDLRGLHVMDVGCGAGRISNEVLAKRGARSVLGIDINPDFIRQARQSAPTPFVNYLVGDMVTLPLPAASADLVTSRFAFHYAEDLHALFASVARVLAPGGQTIFLTNMARGREAEALPEVVTLNPWIPIQLSERLRVHNLARTSRDYIGALCAAGLSVQWIEATSADQKIAHDYRYRELIHVDAVIVHARKA